MTKYLSARNLSVLVLVAAILVSGYLSYLKLEDKQAVCVKGGQFDCGLVLNSAYSELSGIPIAWLGLALNLVVVSLLLLEPRISFLQSNGIILEFMLVLFAFLFSMYLIYVQAVLIQAYCPWCLTHEALITVLFGLTGWRVYKTLYMGEPELQAQQVGN